MDEKRQVGLCAGCRHAAVKTSAKGATFWRCRRADRDPRLQRYPALPIARCPGYEEGSPDTRGPR